MTATDVDLYRQLADLVDGGIPCATAKIVRATGSIPNAVGATMLVGLGGELIAGTIGGGGIEAKVLHAAGEALASGRRTELISAKLTEEEAGGIGMMCGGSCDVFIEVHQRAPTLLLLGGGHINLCLNRMAAGLGYRIIVVDDRVEWANAANYPGAQIVNALPEDALPELGVDAQTYVIVATRDRDTPAIIAANQTNAAYIGVVASKRKAIQIVKNIAERVDLDALLPRLSAPVGLALGGRSPEAVALSILSEVQAHRYGVDGHAMGLTAEQLKCYVNKTSAH